MNDPDIETTRRSVVLLSDFNIDPLAGLLSNDDGFPDVDVDCAPFGQVQPMLMQHDHELWRRRYDAAIVWTRPEAVIDSFSRAMRFEPVDVDNALAEVDQYCDALGSLEGRVGMTLVPSWVIPSYIAGYGMLDLIEPSGIRHLLATMNLRLAENLRSIPGAFLLAAQRWVTEVQEPLNPKLWYMAKIAFTNPVFKNAVEDFKAALSAARQGAKKVIIVDLDDTLWGGILGDVGWQHVRLGGHDPIGEAFVDFQRVLKSFTRRGILLAIVSKNDEQTALEAIDQHTDMVLRRGDFAAWRINWCDKAQNVADLMAELNLGQHSAVFLDDNPVERARVRDALPEVLVPELPSDKMLYPKTLLSLRCFQTPSITREDRSRTEMYQQQRARQESRQAVASMDDWLATLGTQVLAEPFSEANRARASQLVAKTNQMNLTTRRLSEQDLVAWAESEGNELWTFRVRDKFGDSGLTGVASWTVEGDVARVVDFILSCRVMGRQIERLMASVLVQHARALGMKQVHATFVPTDRNQPCLEFWKSSGFTFDERDLSFSWSLDEEYSAPESIELVVKELDRCGN